MILTTTVHEKRLELKNIKYVIFGISNIMRQVNAGENLMKVYTTGVPAGWEWGDSLKC